MSETDDQGPNITMQSHALAPHPRLCFGADKSVTETQPSDALQQRAAEVVARRAEQYLQDDSYDELPAVHNAHLIRARRMQARVLTLTSRWLQTREVRFRDAVVAHVDAIDRWQYWSWITWRANDPRPDAIFDLSYGENSATLALAYDLLYHDLDSAERERIAETARRRSFQPFLQIFAREKAWWFGKPDSNWNPVCAGGLGMLAMALHEEVGEASEVIDHVETSLVPFFDALGESDGGCPEGLGYWNYGMRYAFMYLLSAERARGGQHPLLRTDTVRKTLAFPLDFCPHGWPCSFGDGNHWIPLPVHRAAAAQMGEWEVARTLDELAVTMDLEENYQQWPTAAEITLRQPEAATQDSSPRSGGNDEPLIKTYSGLGWTRIADRWPHPGLYLSVRGGTTEVPHGHLDLLSFHAMVQDERLVENLTPAEYLDTTFGPRRFELFEMTPQSKNVPLIDGVGITEGSVVDPVQVRSGTVRGVRLDATSAIGGARQDQRLARWLGRLVLMLDNRAALIVDHADMEYEGRVETRLHTRAEVEVSGAVAHLTGERQSMTVAMAANDTFQLTTTTTVPTTPGDESQVLRWCGPLELGHEYWMATLLVPGRANAGVRIESSAAGADVTVEGEGWGRRLELGPGLDLIGADEP